MRIFAVVAVAAPVFVACGGTSESAPAASPVASPSAAATAVPAVATSSAPPAACPTVWHGAAPMLVDQTPCPANYTAWKTQNVTPQDMCSLRCTSNAECCGSPGFSCTAGVCKMR